MDSVIKITSHDCNTPNIRIVQPTPSAQPDLLPTQSVETTTSQPLSADQLSKTAYAKGTVPDDPLGLATKPVLGDGSPKTLLDRLGARTNSHFIGGRDVKLEVGYQQNGPSVLTQANEPGLFDQPTQAQGPLQASASNQMALGQENKIVTGTVVHPHENVSLRAGFVSGIALNPMSNNENMMGHVPFAARSDVYVGMKYGNETVAVNTEFAQPLQQSNQRRIGAGLAVVPVQGFRFALSYMNEQFRREQNNLVRAGAELFSYQDFVLGANVTAPIRVSASPTPNDLTAGMYVGAKFN